MRFSTKAGGGREAPLQYCLQGYLKAHHVVNLLLVVTVSCQIGGKIHPKALFSQIYIPADGCDFCCLISFVYMFS